MSRYLARLIKLESSMAPPHAIVQEREPLDFAQIVADIEAETARVAALPPKEKIAHHLQHIAEQRREAALPPPPDMPHRIPGLAERFHASIVQDVKLDYPQLRYEIRACELELLKGAGYDTRDLAARHQKWQALPWQWRHLDEPLSADAKALIDDILFDM
ncbi:hypothetical protein [Ferribacterium limneticum]|uniref:hypothetical protein n=1 Tax=Ferribacterium limneticum TaxID=76259 RepID=UPI001CFA8430|nr:hypothetical protein [Ferribacterium limneticum]UCV17225.1 hypothetical protein KI610_10220 [Ferribacterium limneticum]